MSAITVCVLVINSTLVDVMNSVETAVILSAVMEDAKILIAFKLFVEIVGVLKKALFEPIIFCSYIVVLSPAKV